MTPELLRLLRRCACSYDIIFCSAAAVDGCGHDFGRHEWVSVSTSHAVRTPGICNTSFFVYLRWLYQHADYLLLLTTYTTSGSYCILFSTYYNFKNCSGLEGSRTRIAPDEGLTSKEIHDHA